MAEGLKQVWNLDDPKAAQSTEQADQFKAAFQAALKSINESLQFTVVNAETGQHGEKATKRDTLNTVYQTVLAKIDPTDPAVAKSSVDKALAAIKGVTGEIVDFKDRVEKSLQEWCEQEPSYEEAVSNIEEMEEWEYEEASDFHQANAILEKAKSKLYEPAVEAVGEFVDKLKPAYEKAKKWFEYNTTLMALKPKLDDALVTARAFDELKKDRQALITAHGKMKSAADAGDYDQAAQLAKDVETKADAYLKKAKTEEDKYRKKGTEIAAQLDKASEATRGDVAKAAAKGLSQKEIQHLPTDIRNRMLAEMQKGGLTDDEKAASKILFSKKFLDPEFEKVDNENRKKMIKALKDDPEFKKARDNWDKLKESERIAIMQKAVDHQAAAYGIPKTTIATYSKNDKDDYGYYDHDDGKLYVNSHDAALKDGGFDEAIDTAVHENGHRYQSTLIEKLDSGDIKKGDPLYDQAMTFKLNDTHHGYYVQPPEDSGPTPDTGDEYFTQPQENHSRITGTAVQNAGIGK